MLTVFDIPYDVPGRSWSPNGLKTIITVGLKGLPYHVEWVEYPDIADVMRKHNIGPTGKKRDGSDAYTLPAIIDIDDATGNVKAAMAESAEIAKYLDDAYPDQGPRLFPENDEMRVRIKREVDGLFMSFFPLLVLMLKATHPRLHEVARDHFSKARASDLYDAFHTATLEEIVLPTEKVAEMWEGSKQCFGKWDQKYAETDGEGIWFFGRSVSFVDVAVGAVIGWVRNVHGEDSQQWKEVAGWNGGRWSGLLKALQDGGANI